jgi:predicted nucleic acid-binding protein
MSVDKVVINASPLIILFKSGLADLLPQLFTEIVVPEAVWREVTSGGAADAAATQLPLSLWLRRESAIVVASEVLLWNLGDGESEVLSFVLKRPEYLAAIDDRAARNCARTLGIHTLGTGGLLVLAKKHGLVSSVTDKLIKVQDAGLWLSETVVNLLKTQAGE